MSKYKCSICERVFEEYHNYKTHKPCGVTRLSDYGINMETFKEIRDANLEVSSRKHNQLQLNEMPIASCSVCGEPIRESDRYISQENYFKCANCEKVIKLESM